MSTRALQAGDHVDITVTVCTYNRVRELREALSSIIQQRTDGQFTFEILVINNACTDSTEMEVARLAKQSPVPIRVVSELRPGLAFARNCGVQNSLGSWIVIFDDDQLAEPEWLHELWKVATTKNADVVTGQRHLLAPPDIQASDDLLDLTSLPELCRGILGETRISDVVRPLLPKDFACDGNIMRHRRVHDALGPFDEGMCHGGQDDRYSRRTREAGFQVWNAPHAIVHHRLTKNMLSVDYFRWKSQRVGAIFAQHDRHFGGAMLNMRNAGLRILQSVFVMLPQIAYARTCGRKLDGLPAQCRVWRTQGYMYQVLAMLGPEKLSGSFLQRLEFRHGRRKLADGS